jgi:hypothetical protein
VGLLKRSVAGGVALNRPEMYIQVGSMFENPHGVPADEVVKFIVENPAEVVAQVVFGRYVESSGLVFSGELIQQLFDREQPRIMSASWVDRRAKEHASLYFEHFGRANNRFYGGVDLARQTDFTVIMVFDTLKLPAKLVYYRRLNREPWDSIYAEIGRAVDWFGPNVLLDSSGPGGDSAMDALESRIYCPVHHKANLANSRCTKTDGSPMECDPKKHYLALSCCEGFHFSATTKKDLLDHLRVCLGVGYDPKNPLLPFGWLRSPPLPQLEEEMTFYSWDDKRLQTDCLFALALAAWHGLEDRVGDAVVGSPFGA